MPNQSKTMFYQCLVCLFILSFSFSLNAQQDLQPCGTKDGKVEWLQRYQQNPNAYARSNNTLYVPLTIYIIGTNEGNGYYSKRSLLGAFCTLNKDFEESNIQFYIKGEINYIDNSRYYNHEWDAGYQMMELNRVENTLNCYIVESPAGNCGYSLYDVGITMAKNCMGWNDHTWAHEVGHYLSLPHPFRGWEGFEHDYSQTAPNWIEGHLVEKVDGSNCEAAGDGFCDTAPDYLNYRWNCNEDGQSSVVQTDPNGETFTSDGTLVMSYSDDACVSRFSEEQMMAMRANINSEKQAYLFQDNYIEPVVQIESVAIHPAQDELVEVYDEIEFVWQHMPHATHYWLEISPISSFAIVLFRYELSSTSFVSTDLKMDKKYYWRVRAFNAFHTCEVFSNVASFETGLLSNVPAIEAISEWNVLPNPSFKGQEVEVQLKTEKALDLRVNVVNVAGQNVQNFRWKTKAGYNKTMIATHQLVSGLYFIHLHSEQAVLSKKMVISN